MVGVLVPNPITAAREVAPRDGLGGAVGLGVQLPEADPLDTDNRWRLGFQAWGPSCPGAVQVGSVGVCAVPEGYIGTPSPPSDDVPRWVSGPASAPFRIRSGIACQLPQLAGDGLADWQAEAARLLDLTAWSQIGHELWTGEQAARDMADNRYLASPDATVLGTGLDLVEAIARVEDALSLTVGDTALIHVPRRLVPYLATRGLISSVTGQTSRIFTHNGSLVIADRGYPGTGPGGTLPTTSGAWIYGTGVLSARLDATPTYPKISDPSAEAGLASAALPYTNDAIVRAEKRAAITWLCGHVAAQVNYC